MSFSQVQMKKFFLSLFIAGLLWTCQSQSETPDYGVLTPVEFQKVVDSNKEIILLDVRTPAEFANGRIEGAVNVDIQSPGFLDEIRKLDKEGEYAVYCAVGRRSAFAINEMKKLVFTKLYDLGGGYNAWVNLAREK